MPEPTPTATHNDGMIKLGKQLENPFSVENIRKAYSNLVQQGAMKSGLEIEATHRYERCLPTSMEQFDMLGLDTLIEMFDYPLDYELLEGGTYYFDPSLDPATNPFTWLYYVLPIDHPGIGLPTEVLDYLVLDLSMVDKSVSLPPNAWDLIETEALKLTGNYDPEEDDSKARWRPSGTITVWDDLLARQIPLHGAKARARWWFFWNTGITNANGYFEVDGTFKGGRFVNYTILWERADWDIRDGFLIQAYFNGPKLNTPWVLPIGKLKVSDTDNSKSSRFATIHRALHRYFYGDVAGLLRPQRPSVSGFTLKVAYRDKSGTGVYWSDVDHTGFSPHINVYGMNSSDSYHTTTTIFATTIHELAHHAHCRWLGNIQFWQVSKVIYESWATAVEWKITNLEYHQLGAIYNNATAQNYIHEHWKQSWMRSNSNWEYSPIFIDLVDSFNQRNSGWNGNYWHSGSILYPNDNVTGYTMQGLNSILLNVYGLSGLSNAVKSNKPAGVTDAQIDELFSLYW